MLLTFALLYIPEIFPGQLPPGPRAGQGFGIIAEPARQCKAKTQIFSPASVSLMSLRRRERMRTFAERGLKQTVSQKQHNLVGRDFCDIWLTVVRLRDKLRIFGHRTRIKEGFVPDCLAIVYLLAVDFVL